MMKHVLDIIGEVCPVPLFETQKKIEKMESGDSLVIRTDFTRALRNIMDICMKYGYPADVNEIRAGVWEITIMKN